jgi:hypothetical protein
VPFLHGLLSTLPPITGTVADANDTYQLLWKSEAVNDKPMALSPNEQATSVVNTAKEVTGCREAFSAALAVVPRQYVCLSIHDSGGKDKL